MGTHNTRDPETWAEPAPGSTSEPPAPAKNDKDKADDPAPSEKTEVPRPADRPRGAPSVTEPDEPEPRRRR